MEPAKYLTTNLLNKIKNRGNYCGSVKFYSIRKQRRKSYNAEGE